MTASDEQRRAEWAERVEYYAREAVDKTRPFAEALVVLVDPAPGARVLDIATGPGVVAVAAARHVGPAGRVLATDLVPEWESFVAAAAREAGVANVSFAAMPANHLAVPEASFDAVLCQFGLMFVPDPLQALREMRRVLQPGGVVGVTVWSVPEKVGIFHMSRILGAYLPPPPGEPAPSPTSMGEPGLIEELVAEAGFQDLVVERITRYATMPAPEESWRQWSESPGNPAGRGLASLSPADRDRVRDEIIAMLEPFRDGDGVSVPSEAILVKATKPDSLAS